MPTAKEAPADPVPLSGPLPAACVAGAVAAAVYVALGGDGPATAHWPVDGGPLYGLDASELFARLADFLDANPGAPPESLWLWARARDLAIDSDDGSWRSLPEPMRAAFTLFARAYPLAQAWEAARPRRIEEGAFIYQVMEGRDTVFARAAGALERYDDPPGRMALGAPPVDTPAPDASPSEAPPRKPRRG